MADSQEPIAIGAKLSIGRFMNSRTTIRVGQAIRVWLSFFEQDTGNAFADASGVSFSVQRPGELFTEVNAATISQDEDGWFIDVAGDVAGTWKIIASSTDPYVTADALTFAITSISGATTATTDLVLIQQCIATLQSDVAALQAGGGGSGGSGDGIPSSEKGAADGVATLDSNGKVPAIESLVSSVSGRTGDITLTIDDISGLGAAATLSVGTVTGTLAAGDDARFTTLAYGVTAASSAASSAQISADAASTAAATAQTAAEEAATAPSVMTALNAVTRDTGDLTAALRPGTAGFASRATTLPFTIGQVDALPAGVDAFEIIVPTDDSGAPLANLVPIQLTVGQTYGDNALFGPSVNADGAGLGITAGNPIYFAPNNVFAGQFTRNGLTYLCNPGTAWPLDSDISTNFAQGWVNGSTNVARHYVNLGSDNVATGTSPLRSIELTASGGASGLHLEVHTDDPNTNSTADANTLANDGRLHAWQNASGTISLCVNASGSIVYPDISKSTVTPSGGSVASTVASIIDRTVCVIDFGAVADGATACDTAFANALAHLETKGGGELFIPAGTYAFASEIDVKQSNTFLKGEGAGATVLNFTGSADGMNGIRFTNDSSGTAQYRGGASGLAIILAGGTTQTSGSYAFGIATDSTNDLFFEKLIVSNFANGVGIIGTSNTVRCRDIQVNDVLNDAYLIDSPTTQYLDFCTAYQNMDTVGAGIHIRKSGGFEIHACITGGSDPATGLADAYVSGILIDPASGDTVQDGLISNCNFDDSNVAGINIDSSNGGVISNINFVNPRTGWSNAYGVAINGDNTRDIKFLGGSSDHNVQHGVVIEGGHGIEFIGFSVRGNSAHVANSFDGYVILGGDDIKILGGSATIYPPSAGGNTFPATQRFGVNVDQAFAGYLTVIATDLRGNLNLPVINSSTSANVVFSMCLGYVSGAKGKATFASGSTSLTIAHGLSAEPQGVQITHGSGVAAIDWSADSTNLTITSPSAATSDAAISWALVI